MSAVAEAATEVIETVADAAEETVVALDMVNNLNGTTRKQQIIVLVAVGLTAAAAGAAVSHFVTKKVMKTRFQEMLDEELEITKKFYENREHIAIDKTAPDVDPEELLALINPPAEVVPTDGEVNEFLASPPQEALIEAAKKNQPVEAVRKGIFDEPLDQEKLWRAQNDAAIAENKPHVLTKDEFFEDEHNWPQLSYVWFEGDSVLADEREAMVDDVDGIVGEMNLTRFGFLSEDENTVYVRSPKHEIEIEVVKSEGTYAAEVHGFTHSDESFEKRPRVRYGEDE